MSRARESEIMLGLLEAVDAGGRHSQRHLASELGVALGLVNLYIKRCVKKGLIKVAQTPARRYAYYLTPQGFAEKSRLTAEYLSWSLTLFRRARSACDATLAEAEARGWRRVAVAGAGDLAEVVVMCAASGDIEIVQIIAPNAASSGGRSQLAGHAVVSSLAEAVGRVDGVIITDLYHGAKDRAAAVAVFGADRVLVPSLVSLKSPAAETAPFEALSSTTEVGS